MISQHSDVRRQSAAPTLLPFMLGRGRGGAAGGEGDVHLQLLTLEAWAWAG
eukprot:CAMPEP_0177756488 /NCGR_PEP_ID=MMETSP0491_2-20121128/3133_1 /TAXON_ID=63592 /ORGANISM="Tetraselmis chuii, Strain PLY429" /LENGTH=50 /DNA_ID=CAMNT_0019272069 /DNA_START=403 /DNA_END=555 /DNA_ORIENTATION=+